MNSKKIKIAIIAVFAILSVIVIASWAGRRKEMQAQEILDDREAQLETKEETKPTVIKVKEEITAEILEDGLKEMGILVTQEYYFTEVVDFSKVKTIWNIPISITESSYLMSYEGEIMAGIDFSQITVVKNQNTKVVAVYVPESEIQSIHIDPETFVCHSERNGAFNPLTLEDYNDGLVKLEEKAKESAIERGLLENADENARNLIVNFVTGLLGEPDYRISVIKQEGGNQ